MSVGRHHLYLLKDVHDPQAALPSCSSPCLAAAACWVWEALGAGRRVEPGPGYCHAPVCCWLPWPAFQLAHISGPQADIHARFPPSERQPLRPQLALAPSVLSMLRACSRERLRPSPVKGIGGDVLCVCGTVWHLLPLWLPSASREPGSVGHSARLNGGVGHCFSSVSLMPVPGVHSSTAGFVGWVRLKTIFSEGRRGVTEDPFWRQ